ncbi:signal peptidase II [Pseudodesulfovibrio sp.]|uniref:signal peptidase II n=1 Tax=Pseudodesulfovibrio sp. TaxID=2035812 RepID=UPI00262D30A5|nr:signal peptidase II [Pseudodesulfovibrio sp.]MDD3312575.1 signal peptidase II [Pseudodesulfovibrio sp.]
MGRYRYATLLAAGAVALDQATKAWVSASMEPWTGFPVIPGFFNLVHVLNRGAAWGFLNSEHIAWQRPLFIAIGLVALGLIGYMLKSADRSDRWLTTGLSLIAGGAVGNLVDRVRLGVVTDFLDFYRGDWHWPAFNVADIALSVGAGCIILSMLLNRKRDDARKPS